MTHLLCRIVRVTAPLTGIATQATLLPRTSAPVALRFDHPAARVVA